MMTPHRESPRATATADAVRDWLSAADGIALRVRRRNGVVPALVAPLGWWLADVLENAATARAVLTYDPRGRGESGPLADEAVVGLDVDVSDLDCVCRWIDAPIVGVGWGYYAAVLAAFAARWPGRVERLVLVSPLPVMRDPAMAIAAARLEIETRRATPASAVFQCAHGGPFPDRSGLESESPAELLAWLDRLYHALGEWDWRSVAARLTMPTLIIHGDRDVIEVEQARQWATLARDAKLFVLGGTTRYPWLEARGHFTAALTHFLAP
jgi:pimeloyl-ACP methyl ester carboxylesterase